MESLWLFGQNARWFAGLFTDNSNSGAWVVTVELNDEYDDEPKSVRNLIERLRKLGESTRPRDHLHPVAVNSELNGRLYEVSDRQIGQLFFDFCWAPCYVFSPELTIVMQATDRLRRSTGGVLTNEDAQDDPRLCPKCGRDEMRLHYGIDEPDFWRCGYWDCRRKIYVGEH